MYSVMNNTKWRELQNSMIKELPFPPPYVLKTIGEKEDESHQFNKDVWYTGDWSDDALCAGEFKKIEWLKIRPRHIVHQGRLVPDKIEDETELFIEILNKHNIFFEENNGCFKIPGYL